MSNVVRKKKLTRGEKMLLVAPLFVLVVSGAIQFGGELHERWFPRTFAVDGTINFVRYSPDSQLLAASYSTTNAAGVEVFNLRVWDIQSGAVLWTMPTRSWVGGIDMSPNNGLLSIGLPPTRNNPNSKIVVFDLRTGQPVWNTSFKGYVDAGLFSPDGRFVVSQGANIQVRAAGTGVLRHILPVQCKTSGQWLRFTRDGKSIMMLQSSNIQSETAPSQVQIWSIQTGKIVRRLPSRATAWAELPKEQDNAVTLERPRKNSPSKNSPQGRLQVWNTTNGRLIKTLPGHDTEFDFTKWRSTSRDGHFLFRMKIAQDSTTSSTRAEVLDLRTGQIRWSKQIKDKPFFSRFAPDAKTVCSSETVSDPQYSGDTWNGSGIVRLWNAQTGEELRTWHVHSAFAPVDYSPDSRFLSFFEGGKIYLWNTKFFTGEITL